MQAKVHSCASDRADELRMTLVAHFVQVFDMASGLTTFFEVRLITPHTGLSFPTLRDGKADLAAPPHPDSECPGGPELEAPRGNSEAHRARRSHVHRRRSPAVHRGASRPPDIPHNCSHPSRQLSLGQEYPRPEARSRPSQAAEKVKVLAANAIESGSHLSDPKPSNRDHQCSALSTLLKCLQTLLQARLHSRHPRSQAAPLPFFLGSYSGLSPPRLCSKNSSNKDEDSNLPLRSILIPLSSPFSSPQAGVAEQTESVCAVQRALIQSMLAQPTFNMQLAAVRDVNALLDWTQLAARDPLLGDRPRQDMLAWLQERDAVKHFLRANLHHKQFCEQVEKVLRFLLAHKALRGPELDILWTAVEKPDMHEEEKANVFGLLGALAADFTPDQLDSLFARFRQARSAADTVKLLEVARKLGKGDSQGDVCARLLDVLWDALRQPGAPLSEATDVLVELLLHLEDIGRPARGAFAIRAAAALAEPGGIGAADSEGLSRLTAVKLLLKLIRAEEAEAAKDPVRALLERTTAQLTERWPDLVDALLADLESYCQAASAQIAAGCMPGGDGCAG